MKTAFVLIICFALAGCGQSIHTKNIRNGILVSETTGGIGFRAVDLTTTTNKPHMQTCVTEIGLMPEHEEVPMCVQEVRDTRRRNGQVLDWQALPPYYYPPSVYASPYPYQTPHAVPQR